MPAQNGQSVSAHRLQEREFNASLKDDAPRSIPPAKLLADLLRRKARCVCADVTECDPATLPAHLARLRDVLDVIEHHLRHDLRETPEAVAGFNPLAGAYTLADWREVLVHTRNVHRAPCFVNSRDTDLAEIKRGIATIAGLLATHPLIEQLTELSGTESGVES